MSEKKDLSKVPIIVIEDLSLLKKILYGGSYRLHVFNERNEAENYMKKNSNKKLTLFVNSKCEQFGFIPARFDKNNDNQVKS